MDFGNGSPFGIPAFDMGKLPAKAKLAWRCDYFDLMDRRDYGASSAQGKPSLIGSHLS
jgi:hypothetical protein